MLKVYNTLSRKKETFKPLRPPFVGMYVCGPTVYDDPHLGHAKSYISFDVIVRFLRFSGFRVRYVQNITDVGHLLGDGDEGEDRVLKRAQVEKLEPVEVAQKYENHFFRDMDKLNCARPDISSRATGHILEMIEFVRQLLDKGYAYEAGGNVYFDISRFSDYGKLSGRKPEEMREGTRIKSAGDKKNTADFALWKIADEKHIMQWPSPWGMGYPGWHLECSVMSMKYIGEQLDIHGGGLDNQFPHHECEIAQSEAVTGKPFVKYWLHNNMVTVEGQKMSKSLGNFVTIQDLFDRYDPMTIRFFVLQGHYRSPQDFSDEALSAARKGYQRMARTVGQLYRMAGGRDQQPENRLGEPWLAYRKKFIAFMNDDFNTAGAITVLFDMVKTLQEIFTAADTDTDALESAASLFSELGENVLGLTFESRDNGRNDESGIVAYMLEIRQIFRDRKEWDMADKIRDRLKTLGIVIEDGKDGTTWYRE